MSLPSAAVCDRARQARDARFDGLFFTGVRTTRIYCRPVCPAPTPKPQNIVYFVSAAAAAGEGYRPCLRCRPELAPEVRPRDETVRRALALIADGWLEEGSVESLAARVGASARHLRRLFLARAGATPLQVDQVRRILVAKQLLVDTTLPITQVALAAGFASVRRFNAAFQAQCHDSPSSVRRRAVVLPDGGIRLRLQYRPPLDLDRTLAALSEQALPGIERIVDGAYERNLSTGEGAAWIRVSTASSGPALELVACGIRPEGLPALVRRVRRVFDLDADLTSSEEVLRCDPTLAASLAARPGLRIPGAWDGFEAAVVAALGVAGTDSAAVLAARLVHLHGSRSLGTPLGIDRCFPSVAALAALPLEETICITPESALTVRRLAAAVGEGRITFGPGQRLDDFVCGVVAAGLSVSQAHRLAWLALGDPDAWPFEDASMSIGWRPWRSYAALHLSAS